MIEFILTVVVPAAAHRHFRAQRGIQMVTIIGGDGGGRS
jgi:hypothetical protein